MKAKEYAAQLQVGDSYITDLNIILPSLDPKNKTAHAHLVSFVIMCAATLEAILNDEIVSWAFSSFPKDRYKAAADALLSMSFRGKLDFIVPLLTGNSFLIKTGSDDYKNLSQLIRRRNELMHSRSYYQSLGPDFPGDKYENSAILLVDPIDAKNLNSKREDVTREECLLYFNSLEAMYKNILYPLDEDRLVENGMIEKNKSNTKSG